MWGVMVAHRSSRGVFVRAALAGLAGWAAACGDPFHFEKGKPEDPLEIQCVRTSDCPGNLLCSPDGDCVSCVEDIDCINGQVCGPLNQCIDQCRLNRDCGPGNLCRHGRCYELDGGYNENLPDVQDGGRIILPGEDDGGLSAPTKGGGPGGGEGPG